MAIAYRLHEHKKPTDNPLLFILTREVPSIDHKGFDTDLAEYFRLIRSGNRDRAKWIYKNRLELKYPDENLRINLLKYYRTGDPRFQDLYGSAMLEFSRNLLKGITIFMDKVAAMFENAGSNPMNVLKSIQEALRLYFPAQAPDGGGRASATLIAIDRMEQYAEILGYRVHELSRAADLMRRYLDNTLFVARRELRSYEDLRTAKREEEFKKRGSEEKEEEAGDQEERKRRRQFTIDLSKINFTSQELAQIRIDETIPRKANKVLLYCKKYWLKVEDPEFERKIFLYSKKYNSLHYRIFDTIKTARSKRTPDEIILLEIFNLLSHGYEYSIHEDAYMCAVWRRIKPQQRKVYAPRPVYVPVSAPYEEKRPAPEPPNLAPEPAPEPPKPTLKQEQPVQQPSAAVHVKPKEETVEKPAVERKPAPKPDAPVKKSPKASKATAEAGQKKGESLAERIGALGNGPFRNYHRVFKSKIYDFIEEFLLNDTIQSGSTRKNADNNRENNEKDAKFIINRYIMDNYNEEDFSWWGSKARKDVEEKGFYVSEISTIIARCYNHVKDLSLTEEYRRLKKR